MILRKHLIMCLLGVDIGNAGARGTSTTAGARAGRPWLRGRQGGGAVATNASSGHGAYRAPQAGACLVPGGLDSDTFRDAEGRNCTAWRQTNCQTGSLAMAVIRGHCCQSCAAAPSMTLSRRITRGGGGPGSLEQTVTSRYITVIACAKCGSTSVLSWLYEALHGHAFHTTHRSEDYVHRISHWEQVPPMVAVSRPHPPRGATTYLILARDPLSRYTSTFRSKIQCVHESDRGACARLGVDCRDREAIIKSFAVLASRAGVKLAPQKDAHGPACT